MAKDPKVQLTIEVSATLAQWAQEEAQGRGISLSQEVSRALFFAYSNLDTYLDIEE